MLLSKTMVENMLQPLPASVVNFLIHASFSWSPDHSDPSYLSAFELFILHPAFSPSLVQSLQHHREQSQWPCFSHSLCSSFPCSPCKAPSFQMLSPWPPIFVLLLVFSAIEVGTSFSRQPEHQAGECQKSRRHRHHVLNMCTESHPGHQQQEGLV